MILTFDQWWATRRYKDPRSSADAFDRCKAAWHARDAEIADLQRQLAETQHQRDGEWIDFIEDRLHFGIIPETMEGALDMLDAYVREWVAELLKEHNYFYREPFGEEKPGGYYCLCGWEGPDRASYWAHLAANRAKVTP